MANEKLAREWIADLRSGKFTPTRDALCTGEDHCPLGVLSQRVASDKRVKATGWSWDGRAWVNDDERETGRIPWVVWKAVGFDDLSVPSAGYLARRAAMGETFETIAEYIELALTGARVGDFV